MSEVKSWKLPIPRILILILIDSCCKCFGKMIIGCGLFPIFLEIKHFHFRILASEHMMERVFWRKLTPATLTAGEISGDFCLGRPWGEQGGGKEAAQRAKPVLAAALAAGSNSHGVSLPDFYCMTERATARVRESHLPEQPWALLSVLKCCYHWCWWDLLPGVANEI